MIITVAIVYFAVVIEYFTVQFITNGLRDCRTRPPDYLQTMILGTSILLIAFTYIIDFILMFKQLIKCKFYSICYKDDPFFFRSQQWIIGFIVILSMIITGSYGLFSNVLSELVRNDVNLVFVNLIIYYLAITFFSIFFYVTIFYLTGYVLIITIFQKIF